jgi:hypothetical protein
MDVTQHPMRSQRNQWSSRPWCSSLPWFPEKPIERDGLLLLSNFVNVRQPSQMGHQTTTVALTFEAPAEEREPAMPAITPDDRYEGGVCGDQR